MGYTTNSIVIDKELSDVFLIINNVENWTELHGYQSAEVIEKKRLVDDKIKLVLKIIGDEEEENEQGEKHFKTWTSQRVLDFSTYSARGVRLEPIYPFKHWILDVILSKEKNGTKMTWIQDFTMDEKTGLTDEEVEVLINNGSKMELKNFKTKIEDGVVSKKLKN